MIRSYRNNDPTVCNVEEEVFRVFPGSWPLETHHISPTAQQECSRGKKGSRRTIPHKPHFCFPAQKESHLRHHSCCLDHRWKENKYYYSVSFH